MHSAVAPFPGATVFVDTGAGAGRTTGGAAAVGVELGLGAVAVAAVSSVGVVLTTGPATDVVDDAGVAAVTGSDVVDGGASAPMVMMIMDAPSAMPPAERLLSPAQPTRPRAKAITPTTSAKNPNIIAAPLRPDLMAPITPAKARPPQPNAPAASSLRLVAGAACFDARLFLNIGRTIVVSAGTPEMKCPVHYSPSQHLC